MNKNKLKFWVLLLAGLLLFGNLWSQTPAVTYMEGISAEFKKSMEEMWDYTSAAAHGRSAKKVENKRQQLIQAQEASLKKIRTMKPFEGNARFRDSASAYFSTSLSILKQDYQKIIDLESIREQSVDGMEAYLMANEKVNQKMEQNSSMIETEYEGFANSNKVTLVESQDKLGKKLGEAGKVYQYHNQVYLEFFKSLFHVSAVFEAIQKNNFNAFEQHRSALSKASGSGLDKMKDFPAFNGDINLRRFCMEALKYHKSLADTKLKPVSDYFLEKEKFDKVKHAFDVKKEKDRTKADIDQYNTAAKSMNEKADLFNNAVKECVDESNKKTENWNKASEEFTHKHVPKKRG